MNNCIRVIDARMGRGKTTAATEYMASMKGSKRFLYITPYLTEVERICDRCDFRQPSGDRTSKLEELKMMLNEGLDISSTHALFYLMDDEALKLVRDKKYCLVIDEAIDVIRKVNVSTRDMKIVLDTLADEDEDGFLTWKDEEYVGKFSEMKEMADAGSLVRLDSAFLYILRPDVISSFENVIMMTYLFGGQYQRAYLDYFGFEYKICGIDSENGYRFTDVPDSPPPVDYHDLIHIIDDDKMNAIGDKEFSLSRNWYASRGKKNADIISLRNNLNTFFRRRTESTSATQLWTCFKSDEEKILGDGGRFKRGFLQMSARATNEYRNRNCVAYLVNRYADPNLRKFFSVKGISVDEDQYALSEMLQWIWRSSIRDNEPITLYVPSKRMRTLLINWIDNMSKGGI